MIKASPSQVYKNCWAVAILQGKGEVARDHPNR